MIVISLRRVRSRELSCKKASEDYKIPRRTIRNKLKGKHTKKIGKPTIFTPEEEAAFVKCIVKLSEYGFPLDAFDLKHVVSTHLQNIGRKVSAFKDGEIFQELIG